MNFLISANTDIGTLKKTNQDSVLIKKIHTCQGEMVFAVLCDGMGGLEKGEVASAAVVRAFEQWVNTELPLLCGQVQTLNVEVNMLQRQIILLWAGKWRWDG